MASVRAPGGGGQPGTNTSTGTSWSTPLVTEYESQYGPPEEAHAPNEITAGRSTPRSAQASMIAHTAGASRSVTVPDTTTATAVPRASSAGAGATPVAAASNSSAQQARAMSTTYSDPSPYQSSQRMRSNLGAVSEIGLESGTMLPENAAALVGADNFRQIGHRTGSTDMGDLSMVMPVLHPYIGGAQGTGHAADYRIVDHALAYVTNAKALAAMAVDLLANGAAGARDVLAKAKPSMTREAYLTFQRGIAKRETYEG